MLLGLPPLQVAPSFTNFDTAVPAPVDHTLKLELLQLVIVRVKSI